jgi:hypothetical protein
MLTGIPDVIERTLMQKRKFVTAKRPPDPAGDSQHQRARRDFHPFRNQRARTDQGFLPDPAAVQKDGAHPDQTIISDAGPMNDRAMSDRDAFPKHHRNLVRGMQDTTVLNVTRLPDKNRFDISAENRQRPDGGVLADDDAADDFGGWVNESRRMYSGNGFLEGPPHVISPSI